MEQLVDTARDAYDLVIIEAPPMAAVVDYKMIARHCDRFLFVVEWGKTSQRMVIECLNDASALLGRIVCIVLNKADPSALEASSTTRANASTTITAMKRVRSSRDPDLVAIPARK